MTPEAKTEEEIATDSIENVEKASAADTRGGIGRLLRTNALKFGTLLCIVSLYYFRIRTGGLEIVPMGDTRSLESNNFINVKMGLLRKKLLDSRVAGSENAVRYYVYDDFNITRPDVRKMVKERHNGTWRENWGARFKDFAEHEILMLEALETNTHLRTYNASEADFFLVPIPISGIVVMTQPAWFETTRAWNTLFKKELFQRFPEKHVAVTEIEPLFQSHFGKGYDMKLYNQLKNMTIVKDKDLHAWLKLHEVGRRAKDGLSQGKPPDNTKPLVRFSWSIAYAGAASVSRNAYQAITFEKFLNKTYNFFYHTRTTMSACNSTQFRHLPVQVNETLPQPSSVGFDIPATLWKEHFRDSKYCLVIRGDNPASRSLWRSIRAGCLPVIISDSLPYYAPVFRSQINMHDYAIMVKEKEFLADPVGTLTQAINLTTTELRQRVHALSITQQMVMVDHPESLFAEAFAAETVASQKAEYYDFKDDVYHDASLPRWPNSMM